MENTKDERVQEGLALFLVNSQDKKEEVYFEDKLPDKYKKYSNIAGPILSLRNIVIILAFIEIGSASWIYIVINIFALLLSILGVLSTIWMNEIGLIIYSLLTTALPGTFFFYQIFELFAIRDTAYKNKDHRLNDNVLLFVFSLPYIYDFAVGIVTIILMSRIANFNGTLQKLKNQDEEASKKLLEEEMEKLNDKYSYDHLRHTFNKRELQGMVCVICLENPRSMLNRPCNDILMCEPCSEALKSRALLKIPTCPKCRKEILSFEKFYT